MHANIESRQNTNSGVKTATRHITRGWELQANDINKEREKDKCIHLMRAEKKEGSTTHKH